MTVFRVFPRSFAGLIVLLAALVFAPAAMAGFGLQSFEFSATQAPPAGHEVDALGVPDTQAGSHPYAVTTRFVLNEAEIFEQRNPGSEFLPAGHGLKDAQVQLPPGFVGNPNAVPTCNYQQFSNQECPDDTAVGEETTAIASTAGFEDPLTGRRLDQEQLFTNAVYNVDPPGGVAAEFGFFVDYAQPVLLDASVRTGGDYGITVTATNVIQAVVVAESKVTFWGVPGEASHNRLRGKCLGQDPSNSREAEVREGRVYSEEESLCEAPGALPVKPFLTNPTSCGEPREAKLSVDDWEQPGNFTTGENVFSKSVKLPPLEGCEKLNFSPSLSVSTDGEAASTPTGLNVDVHVPQESTANPEGLGEADVKDIAVALPAGVQLSPSAADGLQSCSDAQIGFEGYKELDESGRQIPVFSPGAPSCPDASKIANARIVTPLLEHELAGAVYLAAPQNFVGLPENPFSSLIAMYLIAEEEKTGVLVKLPGRVSLNQATGQITATFEDLPQLPFSESKLEFYGTARAPLATPALCGTYNTESSFTPWSSTAPVNPPASFKVTSGPDGSPCSDPLPFAPSLASGSTNINAGSFSPLTTTLSREDGQQQIQQVTLHYPPGVSGILAGIPLCGEAQADAGTCGAASEIGETIVSVGLGNDPFSVTGGKVYLTGPYNGSGACTVGEPGCAPFGLSIVNPAAAGPFDLQEGRPVVVRAKIEVDPHTAALTVTTNTAAEGYAIPSMIEGIPLQIKHVNVDITRPGFTFNPTNCNPTKITGTIDSAEGASSPVSIPFQVTNCGDLKFAPDFKVTTQGKTSKAQGASLTAKILYPEGQEYANIAKVKVELPKQLPSRLTTLQKACTAAQFNANPAGCPSASVIGHAKAITPLLPVALEGPAYFVSNGGEAFPNLIMVLQGYGVTIDLVGDTFISKAGITSSTFKTVPDQPVTSFELTLPEGKYSALAANGNLCALTRTVTVKKKVSTKAKGHKRTTIRKVKETLGEPLLMPNEFVAQNGAVIHQTTTISVTGCVKAVRHERKKKKHKKKKKQ